MPEPLREIPKSRWKHYYTINEVAGKIHRAPKTIKAWIRSGEVKGATRYGVRGDGSSDQFVWLYTQTDLNRLRRYARKQKARQAHGASIARRANRSD